MDSTYTRPPPGRHLFCINTAATPAAQSNSDVWSGEPNMPTAAIAKQTALVKQDDPTAQHLDSEDMPHVCLCQYIKS